MQLAIINVATLDQAGKYSKKVFHVYFYELMYCCKESKSCADVEKRRLA